MNSKVYFKLLLLSISVTYTAFATQSASITLTNPQKPNSIIMAAWQGPNQPQDQIVYSMPSASGEMEHTSFIYTMRGPTILFNEPGNELIELSYKSHLQGTLVKLKIDCRQEALKDGMCKVLDKNDQNNTK